MTRKKKIVLVVVIVIALAVAGLLVWLFHGRSSGTTGGVFVQSVMTSTPHPPALPTVAAAWWRPRRQKRWRSTPAKP